MEDFYKADIFFVVTTFAVLLGTIVLTVVLLYALSVLAELRKIISRLREETDRLAQDAEGLRNKVRDEGIVSLVLGQWNKYRQSQRRQKAPKE